MNRNEALVQLLDRSGKTQAEIARLSGVNTSQIQNWKNFKNAIRIDSLKKVAEACGFEIKYNKIDDVKLIPLESNLAENDNTLKLVIKDLLKDKEELKKENTELKELLQLKSSMGNEDNSILDELHKDHVDGILLQYDYKTKSHAGVVIYEPLDKEDFKIQAELYRQFIGELKELHGEALDNHEN